MIEYKETKQIPKEKIEKLYLDAGWVLYTRDLPSLLMGIEHSQEVVTAWCGSELVGLARTVGDGQTILYVQDLLVLESYRKKGIGKTLLKMLVEKYPNVRQKVLLPEIEAIEFYEKQGWGIEWKSLMYGEEV